mmetsp:Transcript_87570/g.248295  ORF Transcript_87570/g.248295 Transcript_87570/m.248295 type:complete len:94 (-) Transcript_87570:41-322(-)
MVRWHIRLPLAAPLLRAALVLLALSMAWGTSLLMPACGFQDSAGDCTDDVSFLQTRGTAGIRSLSEPPAEELLQESEDESDELDLPPGASIDG